jgi:hypothetical protein
MLRRSPLKKILCKVLLPVLDDLAPDVIGVAAHERARLPGNLALELERKETVDERLVVRAVRETGDERRNVYVVEHVLAFARDVPRGVGGRDRVDVRNVDVLADEDELGDVQRRVRFEDEPARAAAELVGRSLERAELGVVHFQSDPRGLRLVGCPGHVDGKVVVPAYLEDLGGQRSSPDGVLKNSKEISWDSTETSNSFDLRSRQALYQQQK